MESMNNQAAASQSLIVSSLYVLVCLFLFVDKYQFGVCNYIKGGYLKGKKSNRCIFRFREYHSASDSLIDCISIII